MLIKLNTIALIFILTINSEARIADGFWSTGCRNGLKKEQIYASNNRVISTESFFQDAGCLHESFRFQTIGFVRYYEETDNFIDFYYEEIYLSLFKQNVIDDFNKRKACGYSDWAYSQTQNITGLKCAIFNLDRPTQIPAAGNIKYGIFQSAENKLYYGKLSQALDSSSSDKRPIEINSLIEYIFQK